jgi:Carboxylesterase family
MVVSTLFVAFFLVAVVGASHGPSLIRPYFSRHSLSGTYVITPIGIAQGTVPTNGTSRFAVKYACAQRWQNAEVADIWELPYASSVDQAMAFTYVFCSDGSSDPTSLPLACPQSNLNSSQYSEDCLSMLLYVPSRATASTRLPVFLWLVFNSSINVVS